MTGWRLDPAGVRLVLTACQGQAEALGKGLTEDKFNEIGSAVTGGATAGGPSVNGVQMQVATAVGELFEDQKANFTTIRNHINAGILGVGNALIAYQNGNIDMATNFQTQMIRSADSGDFAYFDKYGYKG
ncbi:MAG: DUF6507 family protein [Dermatophilaceae bacterium]